MFGVKIVSCASSLFFPAFHYVAHSQCGDLVDQIMLGTTYFGWRKSNASAEFLSDAMRQANEVVEFLDPKGPGERLCYHSCSFCVPFIYPEYS